MPNQRVKTFWDLPDEVFRIVRAAKGPTKLARACQVRYHTILTWKRIPEHHLDTIYLLTGIHPAEMRPDLFDPNRERKKRGVLPPASPARRPRYKKRPTKISKKDVDLAWLDQDIRFN